jgi:predicted DNA-binding protein YlxM (UPF0122 family)
MDEIIHIQKDLIEYFEFAQKGEHQPRSKKELRLTVDEYNMIFQWYEKGMSVSNISKKFKISRPTVYTILDKVRKDLKKMNFLSKMKMKIKICLTL